VLAAILSPFAAHLPWPLGVWPKVEPTIVLLHAGAGLCALGIAWSCITFPAAAVSAIRHPLVLIALAVALWSMAVSPAARYPLLSIAGSPQIADGAVLWLDSAVFIAGIRLVRLSPKCLETLGFTALFCAILLPALAWFPATRGLWFNDYLAFLGLAAAVAVPLSLDRRFPKAWMQVALALAAGLPALAVSGNATAILSLAGVSAPLFAILYFLNRRDNQSHLRWVRPGAAACVVAIAIAAPFAIEWVGSLGIMTSIESRARIFDVIYDFLSRNPSTLLTGKGWGHTEHYFAESLANSGATMWDRSWDATWRDIFHTHNLILEALLSGGLPATVGIIAFSAMLPLCSSRRNLPAAAAYAAGYTCIASFWFVIPGTVPYSLFAVAMLTRQVPHDEKRRGPAWFPTAATAAIACIQFVLAAVLAGFAWNAARIDARLAQPGAGWEQTDPGCNNYPQENWRGDTGLALQLLRAFNRVADAPPGRSIPPADLEQLGYYACAATVRGLENRSRTLLRAGLLFRSQLAYDARFEPFRGKFGRFLDDWEAQVRSYLTLEPERADLIYPYLSWELSRNRYATVVDLTDAVLSRDPVNSIALWFKGLALLQQANPNGRAAALRLLQSGLDHDVERWFQIPEETKAIIRSELSKLPRQ
jgi:O-antigen ligase